MIIKLFIGVGILALPLLLSEVLGKWLEDITTQDDKNG